MKTFIIIVSIFLISIQGTYAQQLAQNSNSVQQQPARNSDSVLTLSNQKWQWMADKNVEALDNLFHQEAVFVHMGATMNKEQELNTIRSGGIHYKHTDIQDTSVRFIENTAIVLSKIRLTAIVGGNEVINPFMVTEIYILSDGKWKLGSLSFTRLLGN